MPRLFSYGTLRESDVQRATFGRLLDGGDDALSGCVLGRVAIDDPALAGRLGRTHHDNLTFTGRRGDQVKGMVFEVTERELAAVDAYEAPFDYVRIEASLALDTRAWVYVHQPPRP